MTTEELIRAIAENEGDGPGDGARVYDDAICEDGWATVAVGAKNPGSDPENVYYLLQHNAGGWKVVDYGTESWLLEPKPLCQRIPEPIAERLCIGDATR